MNPFEIFITSISWGTGSKYRPILVLQINPNNVFIYPITTQYNNKSSTVKIQYYKIIEWSQAGLDKQSYIDTGTLIKLPLSVISNKKPIGSLSITDKQKLLEFLSK